MPAELAILDDFIFEEEEKSYLSQQSEIKS